MSFLRRLNLSSRLLLGLMAVAAAVGVGSEMLRPGHHIHLGIGGHHHHVHVGPHTHGSDRATELASGGPAPEEPSCAHVDGSHADLDHTAKHHHDLPGAPEPSPDDPSDGAFVDVFPLQEAASHIILGTAPAERGHPLQSALATRTTTPPFLPIAPRGPPSLLFV